MISLIIVVCLQSGRGPLQRRRAGRRLIACVLRVLEANHQNFDHPIFKKNGLSPAWCLESNPNQSNFKKLVEIGLRVSLPVFFESCRASMNLGLA